MDIQLLSEYLEYIEVEKGLSLNTVDAYRRDLTDFINFCTLKSVNDIVEINRNHLNSYILALR